MNLKKMLMGLAAALIAFLLIYFSIPQIKPPSSSADTKPSDDITTIASPDSASPGSPPASVIKSGEPPAVLPMPGAPPPAPPQKK